MRVQNSYTANQNKNEQPNFSDDQFPVMIRGIGLRAVGFQTYHIYSYMSLLFHSYESQEFIIPFAVICHLFDKIYDRLRSVESQLRSVFFCR